MFSSTSIAEWSYISSNYDGDEFYVDYNRIRKVDGFVYFWTMTNFAKKDEYGDFSANTYHQGDCKIFRLKDLKINFYKKQMGKELSESLTPENKWRYPTPGSSIEKMLGSVCN